VHDRPELISLSVPGDWSGAEKQLETCGVLVQDVTRGGSADKAGLRPGDVIRKCDEWTVSESDELLAMVASTDLGATVSLEILRNGEPLTLKLALNQRPSDLGYTPGRHRALSARRLRGISMKNLTPSLRKQLEISTDVSGFFVVDVDPHSPAADYPAQGNVILSVNHHTVKSLADFNNLAAEAKRQVFLRIVYQGESLFIVISPEPDGDESILVQSATVREVISQWPKKDYATLLTSI
jgi:serine protease Do